MLDKDNWVGPRIALYQWIRTVLKMDPDPSPDTDSDQILGVKLLYDFFVYQSQTHSLAHSVINDFLLPFIFQNNVYRTFFVI